MTAKSYTDVEVMTFFFSNVKALHTNVDEWKEVE